MVAEIASPHLLSQRNEVFNLFGMQSSPMFRAEPYNFNHHRSPVLTNTRQNKTEADRHEIKVHRHLITA